MALPYLPIKQMCCCGRDRMVVGFTTTYAISTYHHLHWEFEPHSGEVYSIQHYVIKFVSDLGTLVSIINKTDRQDITEILLKVALNTINLNQPTYFSIMKHISLGNINGIYISMVEHFSFKFLMK